MKMPPAVPQSFEGEFGLANFRGVSGYLRLGDDTEIEATLQGQIVVYTDDETIVGGNISFSNQEPIDELGGNFTLSGPFVADDVPGQTNSQGVGQLDMYYSLLADLEPACDEGDATFPQKEKLAVLLSLDLASGSRGLAVQIVESELTEFVEGGGQIQGIQVELGPVPLQRSFPYDESDSPAQTNSLVYCDDTDGPPSGSSHNTYRLRVKFTRTYDDIGMDFEAVAQALIDGVCDAWWKKGGIQLTLAVADKQVHATQTLPDTFSTSTQQEFLNHHRANSGSSFLDIYLVQSITGGIGGGIAKGCTTGDAYIVLQTDKALHNKYLLAHEVGHVLGLHHPTGATSNSDACTSGTPGTACSVMLPENPNPSRNSSGNITVATGAAGSLGTMFVNTGQTCNWDVETDGDSVKHYIRDFPYDDGQEPSLPDPPYSRWRNCDVWNHSQPPKASASDDTYANNSPMFAEDYSPFHERPNAASGEPNHLYVRLHTCRDFTLADGDIRVYFYICPPGMGSTIELIQPTPGSATTNPVLFSGTPPPGTLSFVLPTIASARVGYFKWDPHQYFGAPIHSCLFAVATSPGDVLKALDGTPISGAPHDVLTTSVELHNLAINDNDVAQRNVDVSIVASGSGGTGGAGAGGAGAEGTRMLSLPWIEMTNIFENPIKANVTLGGDAVEWIQQLQLQVGDGEVVTIGNDFPQKVVVDGALKPKSIRSLRFTAILKPGLPANSNRNLDVWFQLDGQTVTGYTYIIQTGTMEEVARDVFGRMTEMAEAVHLAYKSDHTPALTVAAGNMLRPSARNRERAGHGRGFFSWLRSVFSHGGQPSTPQPAVTLGETFAAVAKDGVAPANLCNNLNQLAATLYHFEEGNYAQLDRIRDLSNRTHELAWKPLRSGRI